MEVAMLCLTRMATKVIDRIFTRMSEGFGHVEAQVSENSIMVGVGMPMEDIEENLMVYNLMSEIAFQPTKIDVMGTRSQA
ncbi:hypothetical protein L1987_37269 [Smallanthus sonchifolius]|uniref:Uncharacterized protein n=1 Tax=Smallanthus sonchifolius TaxID=185202 RepID=A0ACB9HH90_9ASTR|nr:hypothetical protein L1987_37269 [Smallanthus sonchifolius]